jgi:aminoglycoside phosphotransferase (APT) family kinase protein
MKRSSDVRAVSGQFQIAGEFVSATPYGSGHINDTFCAVYRHAGGTARYVHQQINHHVFRDPAALLDNIARVTAHIRGKLANEPDVDRRVLTLVPAKTGGHLHRDDRGNYWRTYRFIEGAHTNDTVQSPQQAYQAARAFGRFQALVADLPAPRLHDTVADFHHTPKRFAALEEAIARDAVNRGREAAPEIAFALSRKSLTSRLLEAGLPERVTHNDTKFNNVMLDDRTGEGICVVDLDTVMPGLALYDFGDMVRTTTSPAAEDEQDLRKVAMQFPMFKALVRGYLSSAGNFLTPAETRYLAFAGKLITFEIGVRFLTDFLAGDTYFKVHRPGNNLDRCRTQFRLVESIERQEEEMNRLVDRLAGGGMLR